MKLPKRKTQKLYSQLANIVKHGNPWTNEQDKMTAARIIRSIRKIDKRPKSLFNRVTEIMRKSGIKSPFIGKLDKGGATRTKQPEGMLVKFWFIGPAGCSRVSEKQRAEIVSIVGVSDEPDGVTITDWPRRKINGSKNG